MLYCFDGMLALVFERRSPSFAAAAVRLLSCPCRGGSGCEEINGGWTGRAQQRGGQVSHSDARYVIQSQRVRIAFLLSLSCCLVREQHKGRGAGGWNLEGRN
jgi:hypothetical protein